MANSIGKDNLVQILGRCHNIIRNNDKLSPDAAFDEICKVLFVKMWFERCEYSMKEKELLLSLLNQDDFTPSASSSLLDIFNAVKDFYVQDGLFNKNETFQISTRTFVQLYNEFSPVKLSEMGEDVKGVAFETFLGKTFRGDLGQFFTPRTIVDYIIDVLDIKEGELVCDPCCGSGGFLISTFVRLQKRIAEDKSATAEEKHLRSEKLCNEFIYGMEANERMARTAKMNMIMHGDGHTSVYHHDGLVNCEDIHEGMFDVILMNPPYGVKLDPMQTVSDNPEDALHFVKDFYTLSHSQEEALFVERCIRLLKQGGRAGIVLPEGILNTSVMEDVRQYIARNAEVLNITSIPDDVFKSAGTNVKTVILFIKKHLYETPSIDRLSCSVTMVKDAGISKLGLPTKNEELKTAAQEISCWLHNGFLDNAKYTKKISIETTRNWDIKRYFNESLRVFSNVDGLVPLSDVLKPVVESMNIEDNALYNRLTVRLKGMGIILRDSIYGRLIGTKRQTVVHTGNLIVSKIDGKSGAFGLVPIELDGAIVTQDFMTFEIDETKIISEYLIQVLLIPSVLMHFSNESSGSTGRKRLSRDVFLNTSIPLPSLDVQRKMVKDILTHKNAIKAAQDSLDASIRDFRNQLTY